jgi:phosphatidylglycerophosphate synthase
MIAIRSQMSDTPLPTRVILAGALGVLCVIGVGLIAGPRLQLSETYPLKAAALFAAMVAIMVGAVGEHHPFARFGAANHVTMIRSMLVALVASLIGEPETRPVAAAAVAATAVMAALDGVDGWLARRSRMASRFGARFDMETDALLIMVMSLLVWRHGKAGAWILLGGLMRYAFGAIGWLLPWMARPLMPTRRGQTVAVCHLVGLTVALTPIVPAPLSAVAAGVTLAVLTWSFAVDVRRLWRKE